MRVELFFALSAMLFAAPDNPFVGTWKLNPQKSHFTGTKFTYLDAGADGTEYEEGKQSYTFQTDGIERPAMTGFLAAWKQLDDQTWMTTWKNNGMVVNTDTIKISVDGKTMEMVSEGKRVDGTLFHIAAEYQRVSGTGGLTGTWKTAPAKQSEAWSMIFTEFEGDGLTISSPHQKLVFSGKFDGTDGKVSGPTIPDGAGTTIKRLSDNSFEVAHTFKGKIFWKGIYTLSADRKTLTCLDEMPGGGRDRVVFDRQ